MRATYLDTHLAALLYESKENRLSKAVEREIGRGQLLLSPMVVMELGYLHRRNKISQNANIVFTSLHTKFGVSLCDLPFSAVVQQALSIGWTDDPFDQIIVAQSMANHGSVLLTYDVRILEHYPQAIG